jgi:D-aminoacyl-tRNA deacylase
MKVVIQKSGPAKVEVDGKITGEINSGLVILLGIHNQDTQEDIEFLVEKIANIRLFENEGKYFDKSILDEKAQALVISQFTLYASTRKGRRPDFASAAKPDIAQALYEQFIQRIEAKGIEVQTGIFGAKMEVSLVNQGPITIIIDSKDG